MAIALQDLLLNACAGFTNFNESDDMIGIIQFPVIGHHLISGKLGRLLRCHGLRQVNGDQRDRRWNFQKCAHLAGQRFRVDVHPQRVQFCQLLEASNSAGQIASHVEPVAERERFGVGKLANVRQIGRGEDGPIVVRDVIVFVVAGQVTCQVLAVPEGGIHGLVARHQSDRVAKSIAKLDRLVLDGGEEEFGLGQDVRSGSSLDVDQLAVVADFAALELLEVGIGVNHQAG